MTTLPWSDIVASEDGRYARSKWNKNGLSYSIIMANNVERQLDCFVKTYNEMDAALAEQRRSGVAKLTPAYPPSRGFAPSRRA